MGKICLSSVYQDEDQATHIVLEQTPTFPRCKYKFDRDR